LTILIHSNLSGTELHVPGYQQATDPGAIGAGKYWVDTSGGASSWVLKVRNDADTGWEDISSSGSNATQLQGYNVATTAPTDGQILTWDNANSQWEPSESEPDYDSGWFAVSNFSYYTKAHGMGTSPRLMLALFSATSSPSASTVISLTYLSNYYTAIGADATNMYARTRDYTGYRVDAGTFSTSGYLRLLAWL